MRKIIPCLKNVFRWFVPAILSLVFASVEASAQTDDEMYVTIHMKNQPLAVPPDSADVPLFSGTMTSNRI